MLTTRILGLLRHRHIILPALDVIDRLSAEAVTRANCCLYAALSDSLMDASTGIDSNPCTARNDAELPAIPRSCNTVMRRHKRAIHTVASLTQRVTKFIE